MVAMTGSTFAFDRTTALQAAQQIPAEAALVMTALDAGNQPRIERRDRARWPHRVTAYLRLFSDTASAAPWTLYTRDASKRALGFITPHRLPLGYGGVLELIGRNGDLLVVHCTVLRCRQTAPGWYEGCLYFNQEQSVLER